jgi:hypothetical protein
MLLAIEDLNFVNGASASIPLTPLSGLTNRTNGNANYSTFATQIGVTTVLRPGSSVPAGLPVVVFADYSCWVPLIQSFVPPEQTTIASKLDLGCGS